MGAIVFGLLSLLTFFVPLLCPAFAFLTLVFAIRSFRSRRRRVLAGLGLVLASSGVGLCIWIWRFSHLP